MKPRLDLETTIPSYLTSWPSRDLIVAAHQQVTRDWWDLRRADFQIYISQFVQSLPLLDITPEVAELTSGILASGKIPAKPPPTPPTSRSRPCTAWISC
jgi:hypothetical protein